MTRFNRLHLILLSMLLTTAFITPDAASQTSPSQPQSTAASLTYPQTKKVDQTDDYFGTKVADPYRWLEDDTSAATAKWVEEENKVTFGYLEKIPYRQQIKTRLEKIFNYAKYSAPFKKKEYTFFYKNDGLQNQSVLYIQKGNAAPEVLIDPNSWSADGTVRLAAFEVSADAKYAGYGISKSGSDWQEYKVMDLASRKILDDQLQWVKVSGLAWQGAGFYYSRYDAPAQGTELSSKNENHKVYYHKVGTAQRTDELVYEDKQHPQRFHFAGVTEDERFTILSIYDGGTGKKGTAVYVRDAKKKEKTFKPVIETFDDNFNIVDNDGDKLIASTDRNAPNSRIVQIDPDKPDEKNWTEILPEKSEPIDGIATAGKKLFITYMKDVSHRVDVYDYTGKRENEIALPAIGTVSGFGGVRGDAEVFYTFTSFTFPLAIYSYNLKTKTSTLFRKSDVAFNPEDFETKQVFYPSKDGTKIPMFIVHKKGLKLDGQNPTRLYGYGGFNVSLNPYFSALRIGWLEQGGVFAMANLRGGGEYGEKWHEAGTKLNKQNVFDDFIAAAEWLKTNKYTSTEKLAIEGGSNGGLLVGAVMTQRPELFKAALPAVGVMDMLRFHKFTIGWNWKPDYGSSENADEFKALYAYSPLHNLKPGTAYPATLITTADHDDRVVPAHSFKFAAALQEKHKGSNPVLIRIETKSGHGSSSTAKQIEEMADVYAFLFQVLGVVPQYQ
ncbi:MAG: S9 family peptidase [Rhizobacter sp.]|nr:S9 family peptidase [Chlorobiales bacterium]